MYKCLNRNFVLPKNNPNSNDHIATRGCVLDNVVYVSGNIRHMQHRMCKLSNLKNIRIFKAYRNTELNSWSAEDNVD